MPTSHLLRLRWQGYPMALVAFAHLFCIVALMAQGSARLTPHGLTEPFAGAQPLLADLLRRVDLRCSGGSGALVRWAGVMGYAGAVALLLRGICRQPNHGERLPPLACLCAAATLALGFGFLPQLRVLMQPAHAVEVGSIALALAVVVRLATGPGHGARAVLAALATATAATCCGPAGAAVFAPLLLGLLLQRRTPLAVCAVVGATALIGCAVALRMAQAGTLPAAGQLDLLAIGRSVPRWLATPVAQAWLGLADPSFENGIAGVVAQQRPHGAALVYVADLTGTLLGGAKLLHVAATVLGLGGLFAFVRRAVAVWHARGRQPTAAENAQRYGLLLASFGLAAGWAACTMRGDRFRAEPTLLFAASHLPWSLTFWMGLAIASLAARPEPQRLVRWAWLLLLAGLLLWPVQRAWIVRSVAAPPHEHAALAPADVARPATSLASSAFSRPTDVGERERLR